MDSDTWWSLLDRWECTIIIVMHKIFFKVLGYVQKIKLLRVWNLDQMHSSWTVNDMIGKGSLTVEAHAHYTSCCLFNKWIYKVCAKVSAIRVNLYGWWYCWGQAKRLLYGIARCPHFRGPACMQVYGGDGIPDRAKCPHYRTFRWPYFQGCP